MDTEPFRSRPDHYYKDRYFPFLRLVDCGCSRASANSRNWRANSDNSFLFHLSRNRSSTFISRPLSLFVGTVFARLVLFFFVSARISLATTIVIFSPASARSIAFSRATSGTDGAARR